jgi:hypothetical protein
MRSRFKQYLAQQILFSGSKLVGSFIFAKGIFKKKVKKDRTNISGVMALVPPLLSDSSLCAPVNTVEEALEIGMIGMRPRSPELVGGSSKQ